MLERKRKLTEFVREGRFAAEILVELHDSDDRWSPTMSLDDAPKVEVVQLALKRGHITEAAKYGRVFELKPVAEK